MFDNGGMVEFRTDEHGMRRRAHKKYVQAICHIGREGRVEPAAVMWPDGRRFSIDEVLEHGTYGADIGGTRQARYRVRFGRHEADLYLERKARAALPRPAASNGCAPVAPRPAGGASE